MRFVDEARIHAVAGHGGAGMVAFRREALVPLGGPSGGDGGRGGSILFIASSSRPTLLDIKNQRICRAEPGTKGGPWMRTGRAGVDLVVEVPVGTLVYDDESGELLVDLVDEGQEFAVAAGGRGGKGNAHFKSSRNRTPDYSQEGEPGEERHLRLELKVMADVGVIGFPNAGKSSLVRAISASKAQVAEYPFTTLVPNLGVVRSEALGSYVIADIPGLIRGASEGLGLGHRFLRHVERSQAFVHLVSASPERDPLEDFEGIMDELERYSPELVGRSQLVALNKLDLLGRPERAALTERVRSFCAERGHGFVAVSVLTGEGLQSLRRRLDEMLEPACAEPAVPEDYDPTQY